MKIAHTSPTRRSRSNNFSTTIASPTSSASTSPTRKQHTDYAFRPYGSRPPLQQTSSLPAYTYSSSNHNHTTTTTSSYVFLVHEEIYSGDDLARLERPAGQTAFRLKRRLFFFSFNKIKTKIH